MSNGKTTLADGITAVFKADDTYRYAAEIHVDGRPDYARDTIYARSLRRLERKCRAYARRQEKAVRFASALNAKEAVDGLSQSD